MGKTVIIGAEARQKMLNGVNILANAVKATLGPRGRNVAIERHNVLVPLITKDGVTVARHINLDDRCENMGAQLVKSVAAAANNSAGDGTTTATVLAQSIYGEGVRMVEAGNNPVLIKRGIDLAVKEVISRLKEMSVDISTGETLTSVATISANNDPALGKMISEAIEAVGENGVLTVEEDTGSDTRVEYTDGLKVDRGVLSPYFITNANNLTAELSDCYILLYNDKIKSINELVPIIQPIAESGACLLIIAKEIEKDAIDNIAYNKENGALKACVIKAPGFGDVRTAILQDIATITDGTVFDSSRALETASIQDLGRARKVVSGLNTTTIVDGFADKADIEVEIDRITNLLGSSDLFDHQKEVLRGQLSRLGGGAAIFKVGGNSEAEVRERRDRVEDAINAVKSAIEEGIVPGGGSALLKCIKSLDNIDITKLMPEEIIGINIVKKSIQAPFHQIMINAGVEKYHGISEKIEAEGPIGYDALNMKMVDDVFEQGIIDPTKVVRSALEHAASAGGILLTTQVSIFTSEKEDNK